MPARTSSSAQGSLTPSGMGVEQISLELFDLLRSEHDLRKFTNAGVDSVHDFTGKDLPFEKAPALVDTCTRVRMQLDGLTMAGDSGDILNLQRMPIEHQTDSCLVRPHFVENNGHTLPPQNDTGPLTAKLQRSSKIRKDRCHRLA